MSGIERNRDVAGGILWPLVFIVCLGWLAWYFPRFIIAVGWANDNLNSQCQTVGLFDYLMAAGVAIALGMGTRRERAGRRELPAVTALDRLSLFLGRVTMLLIVILVGVMFYKVCLRYVFERPTLWANELSLWLAGCVFLLSGLYAMQQRSQIRIFLLYDVLPRPLQRACDTVSVLLIVVPQYPGAANIRPADGLRPDLDPALHFHGELAGAVRHRGRDVQLARRLAQSDAGRHLHRHLHH